MDWIFTFKILGLIGLAALCVGVARILVARLLVLPQTAASYVFLGVGFVWMFGKLIQQLNVGPDLLRYHLSDIGFTCMYPLAFIMLPPWHVASAVTVRRVGWLHLASLPLGFLFECLQAIKHPFDFVDCWAYLVGFIPSRIAYAGMLVAVLKGEGEDAAARRAARAEKQRRRKKRH